MLNSVYEKFWTIIDPALYTVGTCSVFGFWLAVF